MFILFTAIHMLCIDGVLAAGKSVVINSDAQIVVDDFGATDLPLMPGKRVLEAFTCSSCDQQTIVPPFNEENRGIVDVLSSVAIQETFKAYSNSREITRMIAAARQSIKSDPDKYIQYIDGKRRTYCYRAVKHALRLAGMTPQGYVGGAIASLAVHDLKAIGFKNLLEDSKYKKLFESRPEMAPKGAVLVYETAPRANVSPFGHIEIKTAHSGVHGYISVSETKVPTYGFNIPSQRKLIGVMIKSE